MNATDGAGSRPRALSGRCIRVVVLVAVILCGIAACADAPRKRASADKASAAIPEAARAAIDAANATWPTAMRGHNAKQLAQPFGENALFVLRGGKIVAGKAAIEHYFESALANSRPITDGEIVEDGIAIDGGIVYEWGYGRYELSSATPTGEPVTNTGYFFSIWRAGSDGIWRIQHYVTF